jgi:hypothetical protein
MAALFLREAHTRRQTMSKQNQHTRPSMDDDGQDASRVMDRSSLVGAWRLTIAPAQGTPVPALISVHADGTLNMAFLPVEPFLGADDRVVFLSAGHGLWRATDPNRVGFTIVGLAATERGAQAASATINGRVDLSAEGGTFNGSYEASVYDPAGTQVAAERGALQATRITLEGQRAPAQ